MNLDEPLIMATLGNPFGLQIFCSGGNAGSAELAEHERHFVTFNQLADVLHRFGRTVSVVICDIIDLATVDAAAVIQGLNVGDDVPCPLD